jgi:hypothetical protein
MRAEFLELSSVKVAGLVGSDAISPRGLDCILGIYDLPAGISAVLLEPFFIDGPGHEHLAEPEGLARMGRAIGRGIALWWDGGR